LKRNGPRTESNFAAFRAFVVFELALDVAHRGVDELCRVVALRGVEGRRAAVFLLEFGDELLVRRVREIGRPVRRVEEPRHRRADRTDHVLVGGKARQQQRHVLAEAGADELLDEIDPHAAGQEDVEHLRLGGADLGQLGGVVELAELGVVLADDLALEGALEAGERVLAGLVVRRHQVDALHAALVRELACRLVVRVVRPRHGEEERVAVLARHRRRRRVRAQVEGVRVERLGKRRQHDVREDDAGHEVDVVALDVLLEQLLGDVGFELVVADEHFGGQAAELAAVHLHGEQEAVADVDAERRRWPRQRADEADLDLVGRRGECQGRGQRGGRAGQRERTSEGRHGGLSKKGKGGRG
jgi:hypothetical protein